MQQTARWIAALGGWRQFGLTVLLGAVSALAMPPFHLWPLLFLTFPALVFLLDGALRDVAAGSKLRAIRRPFLAAFKIGWVFGFGYFLAGLYWVGFAFFVEPEKFAWAMPIAVAGMPAGLALFFAIATGLASLAWRPGSARIAALAASLFALEWLRGHILTGFPWNLIGYGLTANDALMQIASVFGLYPLTLFAVLIFAAPAAFVAYAGSEDTTRRPWLLPAAAALLLAAFWLWGSQRLPAEPPAHHAGIELRIVQANIPQREKWRPESREWIFQRYLDLSRSESARGSTKAGTSHVVWPESSVPFLFMADGRIFDEAARARIAEIIPPTGNLLLGAERAQTRIAADGRRMVENVFNSLFVLNGQAEVVAVYDKVHLVPFGEYLPFPGFFKWLGFKHLTHHAIGFDAGETRPAIRADGLPAFSPLICYEIIFPGRAAPEGERVGWLLNVTNDAWFGPTSGPYQHLHQARVRAVEEGLPVIRAANTGISAVIDAHGRVLKSLPLDTQGIIDSGLPESLTPTFFVKHGPILLLSVAIFAILGYIILVKVDSLRRRN
jgi:apolipoprotein N-acyltransferase